MLCGVGHLHNEHAKGAANVCKQEFFDALARYCACGARLAALDANLALFEVIPALSARGLESTWLTQMKIAGHGAVHYDTLGIW